MNIQTNYQNRDWYKLLITWAMLAIVCGGMTLLVVEYGLIPSVEILGAFAEFVTQDGISEQFQEFLQTKELFIHEDPINAVVWVLLIAFLTPLMFIFGGVWFIGFLFLNVVRVCKRAKIAPTMGLVVTKDGRKWFEVQSL